jgi:hypothetical protein
LIARRHFIIEKRYSAVYFSKNFPFIIKIHSFAQQAHLKVEAQGGVLCGARFCKVCLAENRLKFR